MGALKEKIYKLERYIKQMTCKKILAALGRCIIKDTLRPKINEAVQKVCCKSMQKLFLKVKKCMLKSQMVTNVRDMTYDGRVITNGKIQLKNQAYARAWLD